jgi:hypothetical protein
MGIEPVISLEGRKLLRKFNSDVDTFCFRTGPGAIWEIGLVHFVGGVRSGAYRVHVTLVSLASKPLSGNGSFGSVGSTLTKK